METGEVVKTLGGFAALSGGILGLLTGFIAIRFRREIKKGELRRAAHKLGKITAPPMTTEKEAEAEMAGVGHS